MQRTYDKFQGTYLSNDYVNSSTLVELTQQNWLDTLKLWMCEISLFFDTYLSVTYPHWLYLATQHAILIAAFLF